MSRILIGLMAGVVTMSTVGCAMVGEEKYRSEVEALKEHNRQLDERNRELEAIELAYKELAEKYTLSKSQDEVYEEIARELRKALEGFKAADGTDSITIDRNGKVTFAADVLFDSGSFTVTPRGMEILRKFCATVKGQNVKFNIVGHTDNAKIAKPLTKEKLVTDTNKELSVHRAIAVMGVLIKDGIAESRFDKVIGMGSSQPAATPAKSRRVEIFLVKDAVNVKKSSAQK